MFFLLLVCSSLAAVSSLFLSSLMEMGSDGEEDHQIRNVAGESNHNNNKNKKMKKKVVVVDTKDSPKPKRQMKTPFQLQTLEQVYSGSSSSSKSYLISFLIPSLHWFWFCGEQRKRIPRRRRGLSCLRNSICRIGSYRCGFVTGG